MTVNIGDLFKDKDARRAGRVVRVQFVEGDYATVVNVSTGVSSDVKLKRLEKKFDKVPEAEEEDLTTKVMKYLETTTDKIEVRNIKDLVDIIVKHL